MSGYLYQLFAARLFGVGKLQLQCISPRLRRFVSHRVGERIVVRA